MGNFEHLDGARQCNSNASNRLVGMGSGFRMSNDFRLYNRQTGVGCTKHLQRDLLRTGNKYIVDHSRSNEIWET